MNISNILKKYDNGEELTEEEIADLLWESSEVETECGDNRRWTRSVITIVETKEEGRFFEIQWEQGLTEYQDNSYPYQPIEVFFDGVEEITITRNKWKYEK